MLLELLFQWIFVILTILILYLLSYSTRVQCFCDRFIRILDRKYIVDRHGRPSSRDSFSQFYRTHLCNLQKSNDDLLARILRDNHSSLFFRNRSISYLASHPPKTICHSSPAYASVNEFRSQVPLTTYADYSLYVHRMVEKGEKNLISTADVVYCATSSGSTGNVQMIPTTRATWMNMYRMSQLSWSAIWRSFPASIYPSSERRAFDLTTIQRSELFSQSKDQIPIGPIGEYQCIVSPVIGMKLLTPTSNVISFDFLQHISHFETSLFVQLAFALAIPDLISYTIPSAPAFLHTIKLIQSSYDELCQCIASSNFDLSPFVRQNLRDDQVLRLLNDALHRISLEYGGVQYRIQRAQFIREECAKVDAAGLLHRLWPTMIYAATKTSGHSARYKDEIQSLCGDRLTLINLPSYTTSEGCLGILASVHTDEYILSPTAAFFEFIKEKEMDQNQPKTYLMSEIEPGQRYELVCTTEAGLIRYRTGDIAHCTRFLSHATDLVPLPSDVEKVPQVPLIAFIDRLGDRLDIYGEKTSDQHLSDTIQRMIQSWNTKTLSIQLADFTAHIKLDASPPRYEIFLEISFDSKAIMDEKEFLQTLQVAANIELEYLLCQTNHKYQELRNAGMLSPLLCHVAQRDTYSSCLHNQCLTERTSPVQIASHCWLKSYPPLQILTQHNMQS